MTFPVEIRTVYPRASRPHSVGNANLKQSGEELVGGVEKRDGPVHFGVCVGTFPLEDFHNCCLGPCFWGVGCVENFCEKSGEHRQLFVVEKFVEFHWNGVRPWCSVVVAFC